MSVECELETESKILCEHDSNLGDLVNDVAQMRRNVTSMLNEIKNLENERDKYKQESEKYKQKCQILSEAMLLKDKASLERLDQIRSGANAQILEIKASHIISEFLSEPEDDGNIEMNPNGYLGFLRSVHPQDDRDDEVYSVIQSTETTPEKATDDVCQRVSSFSGSIEEISDLDVHTEPEFCCRRPPPLPTRPPARRNANISRGNILSATDLESYNSSSKLSKKEKKKNSLTRIFRNLSGKKETGIEGHWV